MKWIKAVVILVSFFVLYTIPQEAQAQKIPKKERKRLVKLAKRWYKDERGILEYKELKDKMFNDRKKVVLLQQDIDANNKQIARLDKETEEKEARIKELEAEIERLKELQQEGTYIPQEKYNPCELTTGTVYKIQIVMQENQLYQGMVDGQKQIIFNGERDDDGAYKYTIACFSNLEEAKEFNEEMNNLSIKTVLVTYQNGKKVN